MKRLFDIVVASLTLVVLAPLLIFLGALVWVLSGRPILFRQVRVGQYGVDFVLLKFRSMRRDSTADAEFQPGNQSRVTSIGRFLRASKLDELPQLLNVLRGEMSLVGPRPEVRRWVNAYPDRWRRILQVKPGITDPAAVQFRWEERLLSASSDPDSVYRDEILPAKLELYESYVSDATVTTDACILLKTLLVVLLPSGLRNRDPS